METDRLLFGSYFFISGQIQEHERRLFNILHLLAEFGGIFILVSRVFIFMGSLMNSRVLAASILKEMFYLKLNTGKGTKGMWSNLKSFTSNLHEINFS